MNDVRESPHPPAQLTRAQRTAEKIKDMIVAAGMQPGDLLPSESELCETLNVSRTVLREAAKTLQAQDIVTMRQGRGTFVGYLSLDALVNQVTFHALLRPHETPKRLLDVLDVRQVLECGLLEDLIEKDLKPDAQQIEGILDRMQVESEVGAVRASTDFLFHRALFRRLNNDIAAELLAAYWGIYETMWRLLPPVSEDLRHGAHVDTHRNIFLAVMDGDVVQSQALMRDHFLPLRSRLTSLPKGAQNQELVWSRSSPFSNATEE
ncbi:MAG: FadR/GntR family transcriptional regulator [Dermabacter sp.]|nr:FadR/GntR family transcriptional regulator [Dermabacter sp.]